MKKFIIFLGLFFVFIFAYALFKTDDPSLFFEDFKLTMSRYTGYFTVTNNPLLPGFDADTSVISEDSRISSDLLLPGGPPKDGIPAIDQPKFVTGSESSFADDETVIGVYYQNIAKAYPYKILNWHEIVNDTIGDLPITVTLCPLCDTTPVFIRKVNGNITTFGVSGKLFQSCLVMYDRLSDSLWYQPWGIGVAGKFNNNVLERIPAYKTTLGKWKKLHPDTLVLTSDTGHERDYNRNPYGSYLTNDIVIFPVRNQELLIGHPKKIFSYIMVPDDKTSKNHFSGLSAQVSHDELKLIGKKEIQFGNRKVIAKWDQNLENVRFFEQDEITEIPSSTAFGFLYPAIFE